MIIKRKYSFLSSKRLIVFCCLTILMFSQLTAAASGDLYNNFTELSSNQVENVDYKIETDVTDSNAIVIAIHGGKIEKGTTELAYALSSHNNFNYYSYIGLKSKGNLALHITSDKFDEPTALEMVSKSKTTLSIHGCSGSEEFTYIGGLDTELGNKIKESLTKYGFTVLDAPKNLAGISLNNIVNKNMNGWGVQIEISNGLRTQFLSSNNDKLKNYVFAISEATSSIQ
ncbi:MAG: poly-gamma-glutamate hydrolase family protein [Dehalobacterium sp.]